MKENILLYNDVDAEATIRLKVCTYIVYICISYCFQRVNQKLHIHLNR